MNVPTICRTQLNNRGNDFPFFDPKTAKDDCNVAKTSEALELFKGLKLTADTVRQQGGEVGPQPTGNVLTRKVFEAEGLVDGTNFVTANPKATADLKRTYLYEGWYVGLYVDYGVLNSNGGLTGDKKYDGLHCVGVWGFRRSPQGLLVWDHDPLFDGRRAAIPYGRQHVPFGPLLDAAQAAAGVMLHGDASKGAGLWCGWAVKIPL